MSDTNATATMGDGLAIDVRVACTVPWVPCYACGQPMPPGLSWHEDHDARSPAEICIDEQLGVNSAERDRRGLELRRMEARAEPPLERERCHGCGADADTLYDAGREGVLLCRECRAHPRDYWTKERRDDGRPHSAQ